jgi:glycosyltransferase involved in cell wall biosynthesis
LIVHTQRAADELARRFGVPSNRITVIEHGVDRLLAPPPNRSAWLRRELGVDASVPLVLFFGSVSAYKGLDLLIDAFGSILGETSAVLVIAGRCRDVPVRQETEKRLEPLQAIHRARWFDGFVPDNDVPRFFHGADVLVMPYRHIDQSGVLFMALSTGLPVVATDVGSLRDYVPMTGGIVVPPGDVGELARAILRGLDQSAKVNRTEVVATSERFLWRDTLRPLLDVYAKVSR